MCRKISHSVPTILKEEAREVDEQGEKVERYRNRKKAGCQGRDFGPGLCEARKGGARASASEKGDRVARADNEVFIPGRRRRAWSECVKPKEKELREREASEPKSDLGFPWDSQTREEARRRDFSVQEKSREKGIREFGLGTEREQRGEEIESESERMFRSL
ncbi:hypothetical protein KFK09_028511 [Dendrobium nobile]|uniref:Uncharacterized protein n=1 Tax=Dendrobium nobile TaxID=94219 RepID=A0A8T3A3H8_DENNO|nr:hypothetical protein KFK09_028511 [Dendrobium nobile]